MNEKTKKESKDVYKKSVSSGHDEKKQDRLRELPGKGGVLMKNKAKPARTRW